MGSYESASRENSKTPKKYMADRIDLSKSQDFMKLNFDDFLK
jgi:hypothetical protein